MRNRKIIHSFDNIWSRIEHKINPNNFSNNKIKDYDKFNASFLDINTKLILYALPLLYPIHKLCILIAFIDRS